ncbi:MAG: dihydroorotate dehydrogenase electron transfer subunit [Planctomycetota bacterium]|jgi:dihydroorotate dehydrogenase electron transfer subunit
MVGTQQTASSLVGKVVDRHDVGPDAFVLELEIPGIPADLPPGTFAMLSPEDGSGPEIPRPFSLYDRPAENRFTFLIQVLGLGTAALDRLAQGAEVRCTLPLGNGFEVAPASRTVVMVAGGVGSAPFLLYAKHRAELGAGEDTHMLLGARSESRLYDHQAFTRIEVALQLATDDGSLGFSGNVIACLADQLDRKKLPADALFLACGPAGLLHAFADFARLRNLEAWLSLETYMGCGYGVCNGCPVPTDPTGPLGAWPYAKTCTEGPVFPLSSIRF